MNFLNNTDGIIINPKSINCIITGVLVGLAVYIYHKLMIVLKKLAMIIILGCLGNDNFPLFNQSRMSPKFTYPSNVVTIIMKYNDVKYPTIIGNWQIITFLLTDNKLVTYISIIKLLNNKFNIY